MTIARPKMRLADDSELLRAYAATGSADAFRQLVDRHLPAVHAAANRILRRMNLVHHADDVAQSVFILLAQNAAKIQTGAPPIGWLYKVTHYACANLQRLERIRQKHEQETAAMRPTAAASPTASDAEALLDPALQSLSSRDRNALLLRYTQNLSLAEIARQTHVPEETAKKRLHRALTKLRRYFAAHGMLSAAPLALHGLAPSPSTALTSMASAITSAALAPATIATASSILIAKGVAHMMTAAKIQFAAALAAILLLSGTGIFLLSTQAQTPANNAPALQSVTPGTQATAKTPPPAQPAATTKPLPPGTLETIANIRAAYKSVESRSSSVTVTQRGPLGENIVFTRQITDGTRIDETADRFDKTFGTDDVFRHEYSSRHIWDGQQLISRQTWTGSVRSTDPKSRVMISTAFISHDPREALRLRGSAGADNFLQGYIQMHHVGDLLEQATTLSAAQEVLLDGSPSLLFSGKCALGTFQIWIDAKTSFLAKAILDQKEGDLYWDDKLPKDFPKVPGQVPVDAVTTSHFELSDMKIVQIGGTFIPVSGKAANVETYRTLPPNSGTEIEVRSGINLHPDFAALNAFQMDGISEGQQLEPIAIDITDPKDPNHYIWHNGKPILDPANQTPAAPKAQTPYPTSSPLIHKNQISVWPGRCEVEGPDVGAAGRV